MLSNILLVRVVLRLAVTVLLLLLLLLLRWKGFPGWTLFLSRQEGDVPCMILHVPTEKIVIGEIDDTTADDAVPMRVVS